MTSRAEIEQWIEAAKKSGAYFDAGHKDHKGTVELVTQLLTAMEQPQ